MLARWSLEYVTSVSVDIFHIKKQKNFGQEITPPVRNGQKPLGFFSEFLHKPRNGPTGLKNGITPEDGSNKLACESGS